MKSLPSAASLARIFVGKKQSGRILPSAAEIRRESFHTETKCPKSSQKQEKGTSTQKCQGVYGAAKPFGNIPGPDIVPEFGTLLPFHNGERKIDYYHEYLRDMYQEYGPVVKEVQGRRTVIHIFDPLDIEKVYSSTTQPHIYPLLQTAKEFKVQNDFGLGLGNTNGEHWAKLRKFANKFTLRPSAANLYISRRDKAAKNAVKTLSKEFIKADGSVDNIRSLIDRWMFESMFESATGNHYKRLFKEDCEKMDVAEKYAELNRKIFEISAYKKYSPQNMEYPDLEKVENEFYTKLHGICEEFIKSKRKLAEKGQQEDTVMFKMLMSDEEIGDNDLAGLYLAILTDGLSTTAPTLLGALHLLALNPDVQETLHEEGKTCCPLEGEMTSEHLSKAAKLRSFIKETLRIYPIGDSVQRKLTKDMVLSGYHLPKGTLCDLNQYIWLLDPEIFPNPGKVILERWDRENKLGVTDKFHPILNTPFSHGVRMCLGRRFAEHDLSCFISRLLQQYTLSLQYHKTPRQLYRVLLTPQLPIPLIFTKRN